MKLISLYVENMRGFLHLYGKLHRFIRKTIMKKRNVVKDGINIFTKLAD